MRPEPKQGAIFPRSESSAARAQAQRARQLPPPFPRRTAQPALGAGLPPPPRLSARRLPTARPGRLPPPFPGRGGTVQRASEDAIAIDCDTIYWIVDILGTLDLLGGAVGGAAYDVEDKEGSQFWKKKAKGLYFRRGHWYSINSDGESPTDSYKKGYQIKGTAHFCQTFALMIHLGIEDDLKAGKYADNIEAAMDFWLAIFGDGDNAQWCSYIVDQVKASYGSMNMTKRKFMRWLRAIKDNAHKLTGCREG